jgi:pantetheine-phosphate adenylyltransferase
MSRVAVYPGSFDPVTHGHTDLVRRCRRFADRVVVAVARNAGKTPLFTVDERMAMLRTALGDDPHVGVESFDGLLVDFARRVGASTVVRGVRAVSDFEYEFQMAYMNRELWNELETVFLVPALHLTFLSSSLVREVARLGGDVSPFVHPEVDRALRAKFAR